MSSCSNQSYVFHHYDPSTQKYHVHHTPLTTPAPPAQMGVQPLPLPQIPTHHSPSDGHITPYRPIQPAPTTASTGDSVPSSAKQTPGQKEYEFIDHPVLIPLIGLPPSATTFRTVGTIASTTFHSPFPHHSRRSWNKYKSTPAPSSSSAKVEDPTRPSCSLFKATFYDVTNPSPMTCLMIFDLSSAFRNISFFAMD